MNEFWTRYPQMQERLKRVQEIINQEITTRDGYLDKELKGIFEHPGKMLRPAFVFLGADFGQKKQDQSVEKLAAIIEMLHTATLIHDDIIDEAQLRRNHQTVQSKLGKDFAVYAGDFLFCRCFSLLSGRESMEAMAKISKVMGKIFMGELRQHRGVCQENPSVGNYFRIIGSKTAALFAVSLSLGAQESQANTKLQFELERIGFEIGMAFQIQDDLLDFLPGEKTGKKRFVDLENRYLTLPILLALRQRDKKIEALLDQDFNETVGEQIFLHLQRKGYLKKTKKIGDAFGNKALERIGRLPDLPSKMILSQTVKRLAFREY